MKSSQDNRRISSEKWSQMGQSTRRQAHELRRETLKNRWHATAHGLMSALISARRSIQTLASSAQFDKTDPPMPPAA